MMASAIRATTLAALLTAFQAVSASADPAGQAKEDDAGQVAFNTHCRSCHSTNPGDNRLGPTLHGIFGAKAGQVEGFANYSGSLTADMTWDEATLDKFIEDPKALVSNTTMTPFGGIQDAEQRKLIIDFLKTKS